MRCIMVALTINNDDMMLIVTNATDTLHSSRLEVHDTSAPMLTHSITGIYAIILHKFEFFMLLLQAVQLFQSLCLWGP